MVIGNTNMKVLIVGCGSIGERHLKNLLALGVSEVSVWDPDTARLNAIQAAYGVLVHNSLTDALEYQPVLSLICTPNHLHVPLALQLAEAGSHLFIEKPLADGLEDVARLVELVEHRGLVCLVGCNMRFHPGTASIQRQLVAGTIGRVLSIRAHYGHYLPNWRSGQDYRTLYSASADQGGGIILDAIHEIDYVRWLVGEIASVVCNARKVSDLEIDVEDTADILLQFTGGCLGSIHIDYLDRVKRRSLEVVGSDGTLLWHSTGKAPEEVVLEHHIDNETRSVEQFTVDPNEPYVAEIQHLLECVKGVAKPLLGIRDAWTDLAIALAARESSIRHQQVSLAPARAAPTV